MSFATFIQSAIAPISSLISEAIPDADKRLELQLGIQRALMEQEASFVQASRDVVVAEARGGSWIQRSWRPITMLTFVAIIANNYMFAPYIQAFGGVSVVLDIPEGMWGLLTMGMGGYVVGRTLEKTVDGMNINIGQNQARPNE